jgi:hypothetical protein
MDSNSANLFWAAARKSQALPSMENLGTLFRHTLTNDADIAYEIMRLVAMISGSSAAKSDALGAAIALYRECVSPAPSAPMLYQPAHDEEFAFVRLGIACDAESSALNAVERGEVFDPHSDADYVQAQLTAEALEDDLVTDDDLDDWEDLGYPYSGELDEEYINRWDLDPSNPADQILIENRQWARFYAAKNHAERMPQSQDSKFDGIPF